MSRQPSSRFQNLRHLDTRGLHGTAEIRHGIPTPLKSPVNTDGTLARVFSDVASLVMGHNFRRLDAVDEDTLHLLSREEYSSRHDIILAGLQLFKVDDHSEHNLTGLEALGLVSLAGSTVSVAGDYCFVENYSSFAKVCRGLIEKEDVLGHVSDATAFIENLRRRECPWPNDEAQMNNPSAVGAQCNSPYYIVRRLLSIFAGLDNLFNPDYSSASAFPAEETEPLLRFIGGIEPLYSDALEVIHSSPYRNKVEIGRELVSMADRCRGKIEPEHYITFLINVVDMCQPSIGLEASARPSAQLFKYIAVLEQHLGFAMGPLDVADEPVELEEPSSDLLAGLCPFCEIKFKCGSSAKGNANRHIKSKHLKLCVHCQVCNKTFARLDTLRRHQDTTGHGRQ